MWVSLLNYFFGHQGYIWFFLDFKEFINQKKYQMQSVSGKKCADFHIGFTLEWTEKMSQKVFFCRKKGFFVIKRFLAKN